MIWSRQRQTNGLRSTLREFYPAALAAFDDLSSGDALEILGVAPTPELGRRLSRSKITAALRRGGRQRRVEERASEIQACLRTPQLSAPAAISTAMGVSVTGSVTVIAAMVTQIDQLARELEAGFESHPDAEVVRSLPGLGTILGARVLGEFGDEPNRYDSAKSRKNYAGTSPITRASGTKRVVLARYARNDRFADAIYLWAFAPLTASPGARQFYGLPPQRTDAGHLRRQRQPRQEPPRRMAGLGRRSRLAPFVKLAKTIEHYKPLIVNTLDHALSNARSEATNVHLRVLTRRAYGFHTPEALIAMAMLTRGGCCPDLPNRT